MLADDWTFELGGVLFGHACPVQVDDFAVGDAAARTGDVELPGGDGTAMGVDYHGGRTLTFDLLTDTADAASSRAAIGALAAVWDAHATRTTPRAVLPLSIRLPGGGSRTVFGRPRRFTPARFRERGGGTESWIATFDTTHPGFYGGQERSVSLSLIASGGGGIVWPVTWPVTWAASGERQDTVVNAGDSRSWPVVTIRGPVARPSLSLVGTGLALTLNATLAYDQSVTVDTRPGFRTVTRQDGASLAGDLRGAALADFSLPPGSTTIHYSGTDLSGQSSATVAWFDSYSTP